MNEFIEYKFFKSDKANKDFNYWINHEPHTNGGVNIEMFTDMVISILDNNEDLEQFHLTHAKSRLENWAISNLMERFFAMKAIYEKVKYRFELKTNEDQSQTKL